jgi:hypothetical protein
MCRWATFAIASGTPERLRVGAPNDSSRVRHVLAREYRTAAAVDRGAPLAVATVSPVCRPVRRAFWRRTGATGIATPMPDVDREDSVGRCENRRSVLHRGEPLLPRRRCRSNPLCVKSVVRLSCGRGERAAALGRDAVRVSVFVGFGSDCSEEPADVGCDAGHAGFESSSRCPPGPTVRWTGAARDGRRRQRVASAMRRR